MSTYSQFFGGGKLRYQEFTASGTFTPSATLLANGGQVFLDLRGGGGGGQYVNTGGVQVPMQGGSSKHLTNYTVTGATTVTIGAGGAYPGGTGGSSSFGTLTVVGANGSTIGAGYFGSDGSGNEGLAGQVGLLGANSSFNGPQAFGPGGTNSLTANTGAGGSFNTAGKAGYCRVWWFE